MAIKLPAYDELPVDPAMPPGSSWGLWGADDRFGALNKIDKAAIVRGFAAVVSHDVFRLDLPLDEPNPPLFDRAAFEHTVTWLPGDAGHDDSLSNWNTQSSTQWDGFRHIKHPVLGFYNAVADEDHGINYWAERGIVTRAVLCDVGRFLERDGRPLDYASTQPIGAVEILHALDAQGSIIEAGDVLLIRTGWMEWYLAQDHDVRAKLASDLATPGLAPGRATIEMLWNLHVGAVAVDNPAVEAWPATGHIERSEIDRFLASGQFEEVFAHFALLPLLGIPLGEFFQLGALADACSRDGRYTSLLTSSPLNLTHGVASPPNALAIR